MIFLFINLIQSAEAENEITTNCTTSNCLTCRANQTNFCLTCSPGYGIEKNEKGTRSRCSPCGIDKCTNCGQNFLICEECFDGYGLIRDKKRHSTGKCGKCSEYCNLCGLDSENCTQCQLGSSKVLDKKNISTGKCQLCDTDGRYNSRLNHHQLPECPNLKEINIDNVEPDDLFLDELDAFAGKNGLDIHYEYMKVSNYISKFVSNDNSQYEKQIKKNPNFLQEVVKPFDKKMAQCIKKMRQIIEQNRSTLGKIIDWTIFLL